MKNWQLMKFFKTRIMWSLYRFFDLVYIQDHSLKTKTTADTAWYGSSGQHGAL